MKRSFWGCARALSLACLVVLPACAEVRYLLELAPGASATPLLARYGLAVIRSSANATETELAVSAPAALSAALLKQLASEPGVRQVEAEQVVRAPEAENSAAPTLQVLGPWFPLRLKLPFYGNQVQAGYLLQPAAAIIRTDEAHRRFGAGRSIVAIIDTGVDFAHPALRGSLLPGFDFTRDRVDTVDEYSDLPLSLAARLSQSTVEILDSNKVVRLNPSTVAILNQSTVEILDGGGLPSAFGHGTMVAGLVHLVAPRSMILPLKAFQADGTASLYNVVRAIRYAVDHGATVINMSFGFAQSSPQLQAAIDYATSKGVICLASAGNAGKETPVFPASLPKVIGVGSTNFSDRRSPFSNYGRDARTSAPGEALVTTFPGATYAGVWGTSFSSALASGAAALVLEQRPGTTFGRLQDAFDSGVRINQDMGDGRLDLVRSLQYILKN
ncbi:MAG: S8 family serine peptidase [Acidobacteria bacterium]|nr:S8 family serine peptidase [Acidobacteriota bacterium]